MDRVAALSLGLLLAGCGAQATRAQVTVVLRGEDAPVAAVVSRADLPVQLRLADLAVAEESTAGAPLDLSVTRAAYLNGDLEACVAGLGDETEVDRRLAAEQPEAAARLLFWRAACHISGGDEAAAHRAAEQLAAFGLTIPSDADAASVEVEALLARAQRAVSEGPRATVRFASEPPGASVILDGSVSACRTPCALEAAPGRHVFVVRRDGYADELGSAEASDAPAEVSVTLRPAPPAVAARQWRARGRRRASLDDPVSMSVLATAVRAERLLLLESQRDGDTRSVHAAVFVDGALSARSERLVPSSANLDSEIEGLITDVLERGEVLRTVPVYEAPLFWITLIGVVAIAAGLTAALLYEPEVRYRVAFPP